MKGGGNGKNPPPNIRTALNPLVLLANKAVISRLLISRPISHGYDLELAYAASARYTSFIKWTVMVVHWPVTGLVDLLEWYRLTSVSERCCLTAPCTRYIHAVNFLTRLFTLTLFSRVAANYIGSTPVTSVSCRSTKYTYYRILPVGY